MSPAELTSGLTFSCARFTSGDVRCWGNAAFGQQGHTTPDRGLAPGEMGNNLPRVELGTGKTAKAVATGPHHACAILDDDNVKCWGNNRHGALGLGDTNHRSGGAGELGDNLPAVALGTGRAAKAIAAGFDFSCAILDDDSVKCWGHNEFGQLGQGHADDLGDEPNELGDSLPAVDLGAGRTAKSIALGHQHACAILDDDTVKCWGYNTYFGVLGLGDGKNRGDGPGEMGDALPTVDLGTGRSAVSLSGGSRHTCALLDDASVKCWGLNAAGQLGLGDVNHRGDVAGEMGDALPAVSLGTGRTAQAIVAGADYNCAILDTSQVKCWGGNASGQLGLGDTDGRGNAAGEMGDALPFVDLGVGKTALRITAGAGTTCATLDDLTTKCWGNNSTGMLGVGDNENRGDQAGEMGSALPVVELGTGLTAADLARGLSNLYQCALLSDASIKCWGSNYFGELGSARSTNVADEPGELASVPPVSLGTGRTALQIGAGSYALCALLDDGSVKCVGQGGALLGQGDKRARGARPADQGDNLPPINLGTGRTATYLAVGSGHACAILDDQSVKCWGSNSGGQLGLGDTAARGDDPGEMGDALPTVDLGTGAVPTSLHLGGGTSCARLTSGALKCWGQNSWGKLGTGDTQSRGDAPGEMGDALPAIDLGTSRTAVDVAVGNNSVCAILDDQTLKCWGGAGQGLLGSGNTQAKGDQPGEMGDALPAIDLGPGRQPVSVAVADHHVCVALDNSQVKCWGDNAAGQLGLGDTVDRGDQPGEMGVSLPYVDLGSNLDATRVSVGASHSCALFTSLSVKCWGDNDTGQLGLGDNVGHGDGQGAMGDLLGFVGF